MNESDKEIKLQIKRMEKQINSLQSQLEAALLNGNSRLSIAEKARIIREAHLSGDRRKIMLANRRINK
jgi:hypothetical protein